MASVAGAAARQPEAMGRQDQTLIVLARLMEGGQEDLETATDLGRLAKLLTDDVDLVKKGEPSVTAVIDGDCVDTLVCYLDMRNPETVRGHAAICTSAYLKAAGDDGNKKLADFFHDRIRRGTYDDYIVAFCVAATIFPIVPDLTSEMFLTEGFLPSLGPLMRRKWKSRKVETACLEMLNAACMHQHCREAVQKYCTEWLEEIVDQDPEEVVKAMRTDPDLHLQEGSILMRRHSEQVQNLAAVVLAKLRAVQPIKPPSDLSGPRVEQATTSIEDLSRLFTKMLLKNPEHATHPSIEGLAYATLQPKIKEELSKNKEFLKTLVKTLQAAPSKSPVTYGALSILVNLTVFQPVQSEEEKKMNQLKAYANAMGKLQPDPLNDHDYVMERCKRVFEAGVTPVLVTHGIHGSLASKSLVISIIYSLSMVPAFRGQLAQQGAVRLLIAAWTAIPETESKSRRTAAQALARILISTNPALVFGGTRPIPQSNAIRPLASIITPDPDAETRDLLPSFEALMALTNLASTDDNTRDNIVRTAWPDIENMLLSSNARVTTAAVELVCNLVQAPTQAIALFCETTPPTYAQNRLRILLALADAHDVATRSAAGGALASLTTYDAVVRAIMAEQRGVETVLRLSREEGEDLRHRGAFILYNMLVRDDQELAKTVREELRAAGAVEVLTGSVKKSRSAEVVEITIQALKALLEET
ncbi:myosin-binding striated muscle assembly central-domain-containing protein [Apodospora peruviana]|uniref:Myosin-binding striated muscle assembly central-domain-containing protein n=1 Tax=Apodospora peruviana TaxID=516989 RepID=A0AAE0HYB6_9PEZI|nr:myosin-binding striated muscle assembly central-domain-containing protein [Apodospora peruviana]